MSITGERLDQPDEADKTRRTIFIVAGVIAALAITGLIIYLMKREPPREIAGPAALDEKLEGGLRPDSPDFEKYRALIPLGKPEADYSDTYASGIQMRMAANVSNFTGRTISGLEMKASVIDLQGKVIKERTKVVIPSSEIDELEHNQTVKAPIPIPGFTEAHRGILDDGQARLEMEITAIRFK